MEEELASALARIEETIERAGLGLTRWEEVSSAVVQLFPGSFCCIISQNFAEVCVNFNANCGIEEKYISSYADYYSAINPWNDYWSRMRSGEPIIARLHAPIESFENTEFVNDWLYPQKGFDAAVGRKLVAAGGDHVFVAQHFPKKFIDSYEPSILRAHDRIAPTLIRAVEMNRIISRQEADAVSAAALVARGAGPALVVDSRLNVIEANAAATAAFREGALLSLKRNVLKLRDEDAGRWLKAAAKALFGRFPPTSTRYVVLREERAWKISLAVVPEHDPRRNLYIFPRRLLLVLVEDLFRAERRGGDDLLAEAFRLTPSEIRLCRALTEGSLAEAADRLGITRETARDRLKSVFHKTGTHRQAELVALLLRAV